LRIRYGSVCVGGYETDGRQVLRYGTRNYGETCKTGLCCKNGKTVRALEQAQALGLHGVGRVRDGGDANGPGTYGATETGDVSKRLSNSPGAGGRRRHEVDSISISITIQARVFSPIPVPILPSPWVSALPLSPPSRLPGSARTTTDLGSGSGTAPKNRIKVRSLGLAVPPRPAAG
jgi:hypothetical protein